MNFEEKWSTRQAANYLGHSSDWLLSNMRRLEIPFFRPASRNYYFLKEDLDEWLISKRRFGGEAAKPLEKGKRISLSS